MITAYYFLIAIATVLMLTGLLIVIRLKRMAGDGKHNKSIHVVAVSTAVLTVTYITTALIPLFSVEISRIIIGIILLLGSVYALMILLLIRGLLKRSN